MNNFFNKITAAAVLFLATAAATQAQKYRINGYVLDEDGNLPNVNIVDNKGKWVGQTDMQGRFDLKTNADTVVFTFIGCQPQKLASAQGHNVVIQMLQNVSLAEVLVEAKMKTETIGKVPPVAKGNWMPYNLPIVIPKRLFHGNYRFVFQPTLTDLTENKTVYMKPLVLDGKKYNDTQRRMYDQDISRDPLGKYILVAQKADSGRIAFVYSDTVFVKHPRNVFTLNVYKTFEDYTRVLKRDTLADYIRGSVNPLKLLNFSMNAKEITDSAYFPKPNRQFMDTEGNISLSYNIGKATLNLRDSVTRHELDNLIAQLKMLDNDEGVTLQSFSIIGMASPDGGYYRNLDLARQRMKNATNYFVRQLNPKTRALISLKSDATVAPWEDLVPMLRADSLNVLANRVETILRNESNAQKRWNKIRALKEYKLIADKYLPRLRTSRYKYTYSIFRNRNIEEIRQVYAQHKLLSPFEYWKLYKDEPNIDTKERMCREALKQYPDFMMAANDLAVILIRKNQADDTLLEPFVGKMGVPNEVTVNQLIALMQNQRYTDAYALSHRPMRLNDDTRMVRAFVNALNNDVQPGDKDIIAQTDPLNKVLLDLNEGRNREALAEILPIENLDARGLYIKAVCCSRNNMSTMARELLQKAIKADPKLDRMAQSDADVYEVYKSLKNHKNN